MRDDEAIGDKRSVDGRDTERNTRARLLVIGNRSLRVGETLRLRPQEASDDTVTLGDADDTSIAVIEASIRLFLRLWMQSKKMDLMLDDEKPIELVVVVATMGVVEEVEELELVMKLHLGTSVGQRSQEINRLHLGELVGGTAGDLGNAEKAKFVLQVLQLALQFRLRLPSEFVDLNPSCNKAPVVRSTQCGPKENREEESTNNDSLPILNG
ncbi:hypothetical protein BHM03_00003786 [Ensete ventricosum]|nr:hypothetical protein BHM03_00003786 [Ensete ventricosum]